MLLIIVAVAVLGAVTWVGVWVGLNRLGWPGSYYDPIPPHVSKRRDAIEAELAQLGDHPWAGKYFHGGALGPSLSLHVAPHSGVVTVTSGDLGVFGTNEGDVAPAPDGRLDFMFNDPDERFLLPENAYPVAWGARRYLVPQDDLMAFVSAVNHGEEPRDHFIGRFLLAADDEEMPVDGLPVLPDGYTRFLRTQSMEVGVVSVESERLLDRGHCRWRHVLELDRGLDDGLEPGVVLKVLPSIRQWGYVTVQSSASTSATGVMTRWCSDSFDEPPDTTWRLTTGAMGEVEEPWFGDQDCPPDSLD